MEQYVEYEKYGDYLIVKSEDEIAEAKKRLIEGIKGTIDEIAKRDEFWIVKNWEAGEMEEEPDAHISVAWKIMCPTLYTVKQREVTIVKADGGREIMML